MKLVELLDLILPSKCAVCDSAGPNLCLACTSRIRPSPHEFSREKFQGLAATYFTPEISKVLVAFKEKGQSSLISELKAWLVPLVNQIASVTQPVHLIPAPSRAKNFYKRGFTPSLILANALADAVGNARVLNCLRIADVADQVGLSASERFANLSGAMSLNQRVEGKLCFVVDDIVTTGATITEAWRVLTIGGAVVIGALALSE